MLTGSVPRIAGSKPAWCSPPAMAPDRAAQLQALHRESESARNHRARTRKTCGSLLAALDVHPRVAMQILRHSKTAVTMAIYTEVPSAATREALRKLGQWLGN